MREVSTIGIDIAKSVFQVHGIDAVGDIVIRRKLRRSEVGDFFERLPACLIGIEACASGHYWARTLMNMGHEVKLMPAAYVKPYVKRQKNDAADAEAICEALQRPTMRFVPVKSEEQQGVLMLHRARELLVRQKLGLLPDLASWASRTWLPWLKKLTRAWSQRSLGVLCFLCVISYAMSRRTRRCR